MSAAESQAITVRGGTELTFTNLSDAFQQIESGDLLKLRGRFNVQPGYGGGESSSQAPLHILGKTNVTIIGEGIAEIFGAVHGKSRNRWAMGMRRPMPKALLVTFSPGAA